MRILLDSHDLINLVHHNQPITIEEFKEYLLKGGHENVLSFTNIRELVSPLVSGSPYSQIRAWLTSLEKLPHTYIKEVPIIAMEINAAIDAFKNGKEYQNPNMYVDKWDQTLSLPPGIPASALDDQRKVPLHVIIWWMFRVNPQVFAPPSQHLSTLKKLTQLNRDRLLIQKSSPEELFRNSVMNHAQTGKIDIPKNQEDNFLSWVYGDPNRCPGLRLGHEVYRALIENKTDIPETADFSDLAHVHAIPYVDLATLDRRMQHYCTVASLKICKGGSSINYSNRITKDLRTLMKNN
jgi:hypothetical protein